DYLEEGLSLFRAALRLVADEEEFEARLATDMQSYAMLRSVRGVGRSVDEVAREIREAREFSRQRLLNKDDSFMDDEDDDGDYQPHGDGNNTGGWTADEQQTGEWGDPSQTAGNTDLSGITERTTDTGLRVT